jgi:hypothetical protein
VTVEAQSPNIIFDLKYLFDVKERRGGCFPVILSRHGMKNDRKLRVWQDRRGEVNIGSGGVRTWLKVSTVELIIGELQDRVMGSEILHEFYATS